MTLSEIPPFVISLDGQRINTTGDRWEARAAADGGKKIVLNWTRLTNIAANNQSVFSQQAIHLAQLYLCDRLRYKKATTVYGDLQAILRLARWLAERDVSQFSWADYTSSLANAFLHYVLQQTSDRGNAFSRLRVLYEWGVSREYPGFDLHTLRRLKAMVAPGNVKGHHVRSRHATQGPLSTEEKWLITQALRLEQGDGCDRGVVMLHLELGCNPHATARLQAADLHRIETPEGVLYQLDVPRVKKRTAHRETRRRAISQRLGEVLYSLRLADPSSKLFHWLSEQSPGSSVNAAMRRWAKETALISPRTGECLHLHARRFRYTLATHLAEEGASKFHIADILDHTDLQNVEVYVATTARIADQVAQATDAVLQPLVNRFLGKLIDSLDEPAFPDLPENAIIPAAVPHLPLLSVGGVGVCGRNTRQDGLCQLMPPLSCYTCSLFAALRDGPHRQVLASIDQYLAVHRETADGRILQQLDEVRTAIEQVLARLEEKDE
jgi:integrase